MCCELWRQEKANSENSSWRNQSLSQRRNVSENCSIILMGRLISECQRSLSQMFSMPVSKCWSTEWENAFNMNFYTLRESFYECNLHACESRKEIYHQSTKESIRLAQS